MSAKTENRNERLRSVIEQMAKMKFRIGGMELPLSPTPKGIIAELGSWPPSTIITEEYVANLFKRCPTSIKRAVGRGELPPPTRLMGKPTWTVGTIVRHIEARLEESAKDAERTRRRLKAHSP
ncbi:MAG: hypothetical protein CL920_08515 [Deltaproteobacteria bacterium]|nr:hypothetical protein [Deltaproteobacteria bacterium]